MASTNAGGLSARAEPFMKLQMLLKKEKLFVNAEKTAIRELYLDINSLTERLMQQSWAAQQLSRTLDLVLNNKMTIEDWEKERENYTEPHFVSSHARLGSHAMYYEEFVRCLKDNPKSLARCLISSARESDIDIIVHAVLFKIYGNFFVPDEEKAVLSLLQVILERTLAGVDNMKIVLRTTSLLTRMFAVYSRSYCAGKMYLLAALHGPIMEILSDCDMSLEIDPRRVLAELPAVQRSALLGGIPLDQVDSQSQGEAWLLERPGVRELLSEAYEHLSSNCKAIVDGLISHSSSIPYGVRYLAKLLLKAAEERGLSEDDANGLLFDFFLLRFVNPAIVNPEPFGVVTDVPILAPARRNLTLVAKVLHALGRSGSREPQLAPVVERLRELGQSLSKLFRSLCDVRSPEEALGYLPGILQHKGRKRTILLSPRELHVLQFTITTAMTHGVAPQGRTGDSDPIFAICRRLPPLPSGNSATTGTLHGHPTPRGDVLGVGAAGTDDCHAIVFCVEHVTEAALMSESEVLAKTRASAGGSHVTKGASTGSTVAKASSATPVSELVGDNSLDDAKRKLRLALCGMDFSHQFHSRTLGEILALELAEALALGNRGLASHIQECVRSLSRLPIESVADDCARLRLCMENEYKERSSYVTYLVKCKQNLLVTQSILRRQVDRVTRERRVCGEYMGSLRARRLLERHEAEFDDFCRQFGDPSAMPDEKEMIVRVFLQDMADAARVDPLFASASDSELADCGRRVEQQVMAAVYESAFFPNGEIDAQRDELFSQHIRDTAVYVAVAHESLQIRRELQAEAPWPAAQRHLARLGAYKSPADKVECVMSCCHTIVDLVQLSGSTAGADELFPILVFTILQSNPPHLLSTVQYVKYFHEQRLEGEASYWWSQFAIAVEFIKTIHKSGGDV